MHAISLDEFTSFKEPCGAMSDWGLTAIYVIVHFASKIFVTIANVM